MTVLDVFAASGVLIVAGKGGVGKTTVGAAVAFAAACAGYHVLLIELEGYSNLGRSLGLGELGYEPVEVDRELLQSRGGDGAGERAETGRLEVMQLRPDEALADYLDRTGLGPLVRRFSRAEAVEVVSAAAPGIRDLVTLGKIRQMEQAAVADLIVVDAPASGHTISFLTSPAGMAASATSGPIKDQADQVLEMLADEARCRVVLVTLPEETPVTETVETAFALEDEVGVTLGPVVVNGIWPGIDGLAAAVEAAVEAEVGTAVDAASGADAGAEPGDRATGTPGVTDAAAIAAARYRLAKNADQQAQIARLERELPLAQIHLPYLFTTAIGPDEIAILATSLAGECS